MAASATPEDVAAALSSALEAKDAEEKTAALASASELMQGGVPLGPAAKQLQQLLTEAAAGEAGAGADEYVRALISVAEEACKREARLMLPLLPLLSA